MSDAQAKILGSRSRRRRLQWKRYAQAAKVYRRIFIVATALCGQIEADIAE